jgi:hypothetical protein
MALLGVGVAGRANTKTDLAANGVRFVIMTPHFGTEHRLFPRWYWQG